MDPSSTASQQPPSISPTPPSNALPSHPSAPPTDSSLNGVPPPPPPESALLLCSKCSNGPFADKLRLSDHTSRLHSTSVTTSTPQGEFRANREDDDLVHCPICSKGYANTSTWRLHVKKCAKAKEEERERGKDTISPSSFDGVYAAGTSRDASGTSSFHDRMYQSHSNSMSTPSSATTTQLPPTPVSLAQNLGLAFNPSTSNAQPSSSPHHFDSYSSQAASSNNLIGIPSDGVSYQAPFHPPQQRSTSLLSPFLNSSSFEPYPFAAGYGSSAVTTSPLGRRLYTTLNVDPTSTLSLPHAHSSNSHHSSPTQLSSLPFSLPDQFRRLSDLEEERHQQNERLGNEIIRLRTEKNSLVNKIYEVESLLAAERGDIERAEASRVEREKEEREEVKKLEVELETEKALREDAGWIVGGLEIRVAELESELTGLKKEKARGEGRRREEEHSCSLAKEVKLLECEKAEILGQRKQHGVRTKGVEALRLENVGMKRRIAELENISSATEPLQHSPLPSRPSHDDPLPPSSNLKRPLPPSLDQSYISSLFKHPRISEEEISVASSSRSTSVDAPTRRGRDLLDEKVARGRPEDQTDREEFDRFWTSKVVPLDSSVCTFCSKKSLGSPPLQLSSDEKTRIGEIVSHLETLHRTTWRKICDPPSGDLRSKDGKSSG